MSHHRSYHLNIDPQFAEQEMAAIVLRLPTSHEDWLHVLHQQPELTYVIRPGDTLWSISQKVAHSPAWWPKVWQENSFLSNPHILDPGRLLAFYRELPQDDTLPVIKLSRNHLNLDEESVLQRNIRAQFQPLLFIMDDADFVGEITGSYSRQETLSPFERLYAKSQKSFKRGEVYSVAHPLRVQPRNWHGNASGLGTVARLCGRVRVTELSSGGKLTGFELEREYCRMHRGDWIVSLQRPFYWRRRLPAPEFLEAHIVGGEDSRYFYFGQGQLLLIDKGLDEGMHVGLDFAVERTRDPYTRNSDTVLPSTKGELIIVQASHHGSVGYVLRNKIPLVSGDTLISPLRLAAPEPLPHREVGILEID